jgi:Mg-chelatase subunit ChlD
LSEAFTKLKPANQSSGYEHPYHSMVYSYNEIVDDYNSFCELSKEIPLLKNIKQPERFDIDYAGTKQPVLKEPINSNSENKKTQENVRQRPLDNISSNDHHNEKETVLKHDTVYVEKRDTIYISDQEDKVRSMDGYATNNMILLLDVSGSMNAPEKLPLLKESVLDLLTIMRPEDKVSVITYSGKAKVLLPPTSFKDEEKIKKVIESLKPSGKTDGNAGLKLAYKTGDENYIRGGNNRIILATDGEFPVSDEIFKLIGDFAKEDIFISVFNFGKHSNNSKTLERISQTGKGNYEYITKDNINTKLLHEAKAKRKK